jgi:maltose-binding protein MalE
MACVRSASWSLVKMFEMWLRTVLGLTYRSLTILALLWLWTMRSSTCFSEERSAFVDETIHPASDMKEEAWEFVRFLANEESQKTRALEVNLLPTRKALYHDREVKEALPMIAEAKEALLNVGPRPVSGRYSEMSRVMALQFNNVLRGNAAPEEAVETLQRELQQIIERG